jgi:hypothetical protein
MERPGGGGGVARGLVLCWLSCERNLMLADLNAREGGRREESAPSYLGWAFGIFKHGSGARGERDRI